MGTISEVRVKNFGSISNSDWIPIEDTCTTIIGPNGAGKTNLLNAITKFGERVPIDKENLCKYTSAPYRSKSSIPILSIEFTDLSTFRAPYIQKPLTPTDLKLPVTHRDVDSELDISSNLNEDELIITRYADGTHKVHLSDGRRVNISNVMSQRRRELKAIGEAVMEYLEVINLVSENVESDEKSTLDRLQDIDELPTDSSDGVGKGTITEQEPNAGNPAPDVTVEDISKDIQRITSLLSELNSPPSDPLERLPPLFQNTEIELIGEPIAFDDIDTSAAYQGFLDAAGVTVDELTQLPREKLENKISEAETRLTELLNGYLMLQTDENAHSLQRAAQGGDGVYTVDANISQGSLEINLTDETGISFKAAQRSTGVRWLLGFLLTVIHGVGDDDNPGLVILDDPGVHLHPELQELLLKSLRTLTPRKQVVYTTHSPFLIDNDEISNIRLLKHKKKGGTEVNPCAHTAKSDVDIDALAPIRDSLGATLAKLPFGGSDNIIVEGYSDRQYLPTFNTYLKALDGRTAINDDIAFVDGSGGRIGYMAQFLSAEGLNYEILLDDEEEGLKKGIVEAGIEETKIHRLSDPISDPAEFDIEIEDLLPEELFCKVVADIQPDDVDVEVLLNVARGREKPIAKAVKGKLSELNHRGVISEYTFSKGEIADEICAEIRRLRREEVEKYSTALDDFEAILNHLVSELESNG